jgi:5-methylcytosine-specific restriction protein A
MAAYLFLWKPTTDRASFTNYEELVRATSSEQPYDTPWICPSTNPKPGDDAYMKRTGTKNNGLFARGSVTHGPYARTSDGLQCVKLSLESMLPLGKEVTGSALMSAPLNATYWNPQASGTRIKPESAKALERLWPRAGSVNEPRQKARGAVGGEETIGSGPFPEGAVSRIEVNAYERNPKARQMCLDHHGLKCAACGMTFAQRYGAIAKEFIHVHHLRQLSSVGLDYKVNPIVDLRPVCPNCHAVIHLRRPPYSIEEVREMMKSSKKA